MEKLTVQDVLRNVTKLPTLPGIAMQIVRVANDPSTAAEDLSKLLAADQSLSAKVLRMVNSAYYGVKNKISTVKQAVVILGFETVRSMALSTAVMDRFSGSVSDEGFSRNEFWKHSLGVAMTSRILARHLQLSSIEEENYFMAGLLHDIGKVVLDQYFHDHFVNAVRTVSSTGMSFHESEKRVNGITHSEIGAVLAGQWRLPRPLLESIRHHHDPLSATEEKRIVCSVHFADILTKTKGMGSGGDSDISGLSEEAVVSVGLTDADVGAIVGLEMEEEFSKAGELLILLED